MHSHRTHDSFASYTWLVLIFCRAGVQRVERFLLLLLSIHITTALPVGVLCHFCAPPWIHSCQSDRYAFSLERARAHSLFPSFAHACSHSLTPTVTLPHFSHSHSFCPSRSLSRFLSFSFSLSLSLSLSLSRSRALSLSLIPNRLHRSSWRVMLCFTEALLQLFRRLYCRIRRTSTVCNDNWFFRFFSQTASHCNTHTATHCITPTATQQHNLGSTLFFSNWVVFSLFKICTDLIYGYCSTVQGLYGYCSTVQGLLDWFEVDLGFTKLYDVYSVLIHTYNDSYVWNDSFTHMLVSVTWLIRKCDTTHSCMCHDSFYMFDTTHTYVWRDSFIHVTWLILMCDMAHSYVWHDSSICVTWLIHTCDMTHSYVWHDPFIMSIKLLLSNYIICVMWLI